MDKRFGFIKTAVASPKISVANPYYNKNEIFKMIEKAEKEEVSVIVFPELSLTGYTCGDLFGQHLLLEKTLCVLKELQTETKDMEIVSIIGMPFIVENKLYNCAVAIQKGKILGVVPKIYIPNHKEFYEKRWFTSGEESIKEVREVVINGEIVPFGNILFQSDDFTLGIEICEDAWTPIPPSSYLVLSGANIIANLSASNELVAKSEYRHQLISQQSARGICGYLYASAGVHESTTDVVFGGDCIICENGSVLKSSKRFERNGFLGIAEIDVQKLKSERLLNKSFADTMEGIVKNNFTIVKVHDREIKGKEVKLERKIDRNPFVPANPHTIDERCEEIFNIQVAGLAKRLEHTKSEMVVIGVSGGLDSTLALLVISKTFEVLGLESKNIMAVTMPGFGTTNRTYNNAVSLIKSLDATFLEIPIQEACLQHFKDIGHDPSIHDLTYENVQARERTQILMDLANKHNALVIGTGDLSELALGWCTYNGDHMSMYGVNTSIPKTLVKFLVNWVAKNEVSKESMEILEDILNTPISPELLPPDENGEIIQVTEDIVGPYELHDFFLYYTIRYGMTPKKILFLAKNAFSEMKEEEIKKWLKKFYWRFFSQQFKRSCLPDGPKVGTVSLSPRGDWRMPSDASVELWIRDLE